MFKDPKRAVPVTALIAAFFMAWAVPSGVAHHMVLRVNLEEMTVFADRIFVGQCVSVNETSDMVAQGMMPVTTYTFQVEQALKGTLPKQFTFTELGHASKGKSKTGVTMHGQEVDRNTLIHGQDVYQVGDRALLFLVPPHMGGKISQPVGLYQGAFKISRLQSGQDVARNSINNMGLFTAPYTGTIMTRGDAKVIAPELDNPLGNGNLTAESKALAIKRGSLPLGPLVDLISQINAAHGQQKGAIVQ